jgi:hypothetical protein
LPAEEAEEVEDLGITTGREAVQATRSVGAVSRKAVAYIAKKAPRVETTQPKAAERAARIIARERADLRAAGRTSAVPGEAVRQESPENASVVAVAPAITAVVVAQ